MKTGSRSRGGLLAVSALLALLAVDGCRPEDQRTDTLDPRGDEAQAQLPPDVRAQLDSGNVAYRADRYDEALAYFSRAAELGPDLAAPWFGVYMVQHQLGNLAAADSAFRRAQSASPGATLIHPTAADTVRGAGGSPTPEGPDGSEGSEGREGS